LQEDARAANLPINVGIHEPAEGGKKVKNTLIWIDGKGDIVQRYQKLHLFDVEIEGGPMLTESKYEVLWPGWSMIGLQNQECGKGDEYPTTL
jgi:predicted amidohydrolase